MDEAPHPKRGRPKADAPGARVTTWVLSKEYDQLLQMSKDKEQSLSSLVRDMLRMKV